MSVRNVFGIDFQRTTTTVCLREGAGPNAKLRSVGDGVRQTIPNIVWNDELTGSAAAFKPESEVVEAALTETGPVWTDGGAGIFWTHLYDRLFRYLGRLAPTARNGYGVTVASVAAALESKRAITTEQIARAGFERTNIISPADALMCRWLSEQTADGAKAVTAVAVGDSCVIATRYLLDKQTDGRGPVRETGAPAFIWNTGSAYWEQAWADVVESRFRDDFSELMPAGRKWLMRDAARRFAARLFSAERSQGVAVTDLFDDLMDEPLYVKRGDVPRLLGSEDFPSRLRELVNQSAGNGRTDVLLVGGPGAHWSFPIDALAGSAGLVWHSADPTLDFAIGASWWPEFEYRFQRSLLSVEPRAGVASEKEDIERLDEPGIVDYQLEQVYSVEDVDLDNDETEIPPWERRRVTNGDEI